MKSLKIKVEDNRQVPAVTVKPGGHLRGLQQKLKLPPNQGAIAVVGGASGFDTPEFAEVKKAVGLLMVELADFASDRDLVVVDGGTRAGYMEILGETCQIRNYDFSLVGVAPLGRVTWQGRGLSWGEWLHQALIWLDFDPGPLNTADRVPLQPHHTAYVLVDAEQWGDEVEMLAQATYELAAEQPAVEVLINGGKISRRDVLAFLGRGCHLIVVEGTGRFADELAAAYHQGSSTAPDVQKMLDSGHVHLFHIDQPPGEFRQMLAQIGGWSSA